VRKVLYQIEKANLFVINLAKYLLGFIIVAQVAMVFCTVFFRYVLNRPLSWSDELATFMLIYITFLGNYIATSKGKLARIDFLTSRPGTLGKSASVLGHLITLSIIGVVCYYGFQLMFSRTIMSQKSPSLRLPMAVVFVVVPVTMFLILITETVALIRIFMPRTANELLPKDKILDRGSDFEA
jgi:TRAP-type C4-dicarboxylate transport system permease small subunit